MNKGFSSLLIVLVVAILLLGMFYFAKNLFINPLSTNNSSVVLQEDWNGWTSHTNPIYHYSFKYPNDWIFHRTIDDEQVNTSILTTKPGDATDSGQVYDISISYYKSGLDMSGDRAQLFKEDSIDGKIVYREVSPDLNYETDSVYFKNNDREHLVVRFHPYSPTNATLYKQQEAHDLFNKMLKSITLPPEAIP